MLPQALVNQRMPGSVPRQRTVPTAKSSTYSRLEKGKVSAEVLSRKHGQIRVRWIPRATRATSGRPERPPTRAGPLRKMVAVMGPQMLEPVRPCGSHRLLYLPMSVRDWSAGLLEAVELVGTH